MVQIQGAYFKASKQNISNTAYFVYDFFDVSEDQKIRDSWLSMWQKNTIFIQLQLTQQKLV